MKLFHTIIFYSVILMLFLQTASHSQTFKSKMENLSQNADIILTGKVVEQKSSWNTDKTRINTDVVIQADEYLKGNYSEKNISITTLGGEVGEVGEMYSHMPRFSKDEEVLLFIKKDKKDLSYKVLNGEEGKMTVYRDENGEMVTSFNKRISTLKKEIKNYVE
jgi:hypothetical protein